MRPVVVGVVVVVRGCTWVRGQVWTGRDEAGGTTWVVGSGGGGARW